MNKQRDYIYRLRREILYSVESLPADLFRKLDEMIVAEVSALVTFHTASNLVAEWDIEEITESVGAIADVDQSLCEELRRIAAEKISAEEKRENLSGFITAELKKLFDEKRKSAGDGAMANVAKAVMLQSIDILWMDHLDTMEHLRDSVRLRAYGQRDPLVEYKNESVKLFRSLQSAIRSQIVSTIFKVGADARERLAAPEPLPANIVFRSAKETENEPQFAGATAGNPAAKKPSIGRNDPCPCGSGKKWKKCHGR